MTHKMRTTGLPDRPLLFFWCFLWKLTFILYLGDTNAVVFLHVSVTLALFFIKASMSYQEIIYEEPRGQVFSYVPHRFPGGLGRVWFSWTLSFICVDPFFFDFSYLFSKFSHRTEKASQIYCLHPRTWFGVWLWVILKSLWSLYFLF